MGLYFATLVALRAFVSWKGKPLDAELRGVVLGACPVGHSSVGEPLPMRRARVR